MMRLVLCTVTIAAATLACGLITSPPPATASPTPTAAHLPNVDWLAYTDPAGFSISHPLTWQRMDSEGYPVVFVLPAAPGTTLLEKRMEIDVQQAPGDCRQSTYGAAMPTESRATINGVDFLVQSGSGVATGNLYDWTSYSTTRGSACITITFVLHSASGVWATEPPAHDRAAESAAFSELISTFHFDQ